MNDDQLLRYSRHILLDEIGIEGQTRLLQAHALVIGAVSYTHLTLPTNTVTCRSRWSPYH